MDYAVVAVILSASDDNLLRMLFTFETESDRYNIKISNNKTKSLVTAKDPMKCKLAINNKPIKQIMELNYLETNIFSNRNLYYEVHRNGESDNELYL